ncbi:MAG TPA: hypothetical protein VNZ49_15285 [Bacteroidia bacterium]|nr:hypothetical protein [Bacteroidia bacterium]
MEELEKINIRFEQIYKERPSAIRTTLFYGPIGWITRIIGWLFFIIAIGLFIASAMGSYLFSLPNTDNKISNMSEAYQSLVMMIQVICGISSFIVGIVLLFIGNLCRKIVTRNIYILDLEEIFETGKAIKNN